jgi:hypothetical protein
MPGAGCAAVAGFRDELLTHAAPSARPTKAGRGVRTGIRNLFAAGMALSWP